MDMADPTFVEIRCAHSVGSGAVSHCAAGGASGGVRAVRGGWAVVVGPRGVASRHARDGRSARHCGPEPGQGLPQQPGHVHLGHADLGGDLGLVHVVVEPHGEDAPLP
jgi:hypothetical protein